MYCTKCGSQILENNKFCTKCGEKVSNSQNNTLQKPRLDFGGTLTKAFKYPWRHKALWFFGILIAIFTASGSGGNYGGSNSGTSSDQSIKTLNDIKDVLFDPGIILIIVIVGIFIILLLLLALVAKNWALAAVINGTIQIENNQNVTIRGISKTKLKPVWRLIVLNFIIPTAFILALIIIFVLGYLILALFPQPAGLIIGVILAFILFLALIPFWIYLFIIWSMASRFIVAKNQGPIEAIESARELIKNNFWMTFAYSFVSRIIMGFGSCLGSILFIIFLVITIVSLFAGNIIVISILVLITLATLIFYLIVAGYFCAFNETGITIWWNDLKKLDKK